MSKIEAKLLKATGLKAKKDEKEQDYFIRLAKACQSIPNDDWEAIGEPGQNWVNDGVRAMNDGKKIEDFSDAEPEEDDKPAKRQSRDRDEDDKPKSRARDDDEDDKPKRRARDQEDEDDKPKRRSREDDEDDKPKRRARDDDEDDKPKRRAKDDDEDDRPRRKAKDDDDDKPKRRVRDEEGDDDVAKKQTAKGGKTNGRAKRGDDDDNKKEKKVKKERGTGAQSAIKIMLIKDPGVSAEKIAAALEKKGLDVTESSIASIRAGTLQTLRLIKEHGMPRGEI